MEELLEPDARSAEGIVFQPQPVGVRAKTISDHHATIAAISLGTSVPEKVRIQYDTARNLYLYAWFAFRFYPVAEHHVLTCLELGLRDRFGTEWLEAQPKKKRPTMSALLKYAHEQGHLQNQHFSAWNKSARAHAKNRISLEKLYEMEAKGLTSIIYNADDVTITDADRDWEYVLRQIKYLPKIRNDYAHGSGKLHNVVLGTFRVVSEILNQIYDTPV